MALHERLYPAEHQRNDAFLAAVAESVAAAVDRGWPEGGGVWIVERNGKVAGSVALTDEETASARSEWVLWRPTCAARSRPAADRQAVARARAGMRGSSSTRSARCARRSCTGTPASASSAPASGPTGARRSRTSTYELDL